MNKIRPGLYLGDWNDAKKINEGNAEWSIFNCAIDITMEPRKKSKIFKQGLIDGPGNPDQRFKDAIKELSRVVALGKPVLVHCHAGISRSPTVLAKYLSIVEGRAFLDCLAELNKIRPIVDPNFAMIRLGKDTECAI